MQQEMIDGSMLISYSKNPCARLRLEHGNCCFIFLNQFWLNFDKIYVSKEALHLHACETSHQTGNIYAIQLLVLVVYVCNASFSATM